MSAFDFGNLSERRRIERQAKQRKRIAIGLCITLVLVIVIACSALAVLHQSRHSSSSSSTSSSSSSSSSTSSKSSSHSTGEIAISSKAITVMCQPTDYKKECEKTLSKAAASNSSVNPKDLLKASIHAAAEEVKKGFAHVPKFKSDDPIVKGAIKDCKELLGHAETELNWTLSNVDGKLSSKSPELKNWMSAVMSYQQTCIDGFPEGEMKKKLEEGMELSKMMTSNVLAIIGTASSILSGLGITGITKRRLLEHTPEVGEDGMPLWMSHEERRFLKQDKAKVQPNAVVAKDRSGAFKTINAALAAMPNDFKGRYVYCHSL